MNVTWGTTQRAERAVARSAALDQRARFYTDDTISGYRDRRDDALRALERLGLEGWTEEQTTWSVDAWGTHGGREWRVLIVDGLQEVQP